MTSAQTSIFAVSSVLNSGPLPEMKKHRLDIVVASSEEEAEKKVIKKYQKDKWYLGIESILLKEVDILI